MNIIYEKTIDAEPPYEYIVGAYEDDGARYFRVLKVIQDRGWIETNLTLSENQNEMLSAMAEAIEKVRNPSL